MEGGCKVQSISVELMAQKGREQSNEKGKPQVLCNNCFFTFRKCFEEFSTAAMSFGLHWSCSKCGLCLLGVELDHITSCRNQGVLSRLYEKGVWVRTGPKGHVSSKLAPEGCLTQSFLFQKAKIQRHVSDCASKTAAASHALSGLIIQLLV